MVASLEAFQLTKGVGSVVGVLKLGDPGTVGAVVSTVTVPFEVKADVLPAASTVRAREYHMPSDKPVAPPQTVVLKAQDKSETLSLTTPDAKVLLWLHWIS